MLATNGCSEWTTARYSALPMADRFDALPEHLQRPHIRRFQPMVAPAKAKDPAGAERDIAVLVLQDPLRLSPQPFMMPLQGTDQPQVQAEFGQWMGFLGALQGEERLDEIFARLQVPAPAQPQLVQVLQKLDEMGYLWGPSSEALENAKMESIRARGAFALPEEARRPEVAEQLRTFMTEGLAKAEDPEFDSPVAGIVAPHLDYGRGAGNYAAAYKCFETGARERPDRVVVLGTNHFGLGDGVVMTEFGFETPLGAVRPDAALLERLRDAFGDKLFKDQLDFAGEHSVGLHLPWIQHLYGDVPVLAALVPDPTVPLIADDGARVGAKEFAAALRSVLAQAGGRTLVVSSADLSHVGPQFGDAGALDAARRAGIEAHDRELLGEFIEGPDRLLDRVASKGNASRWCSIGNMFVAASALPHGSREVVKYEQSADPNGGHLVSSAAVAFLA
jgi:AmmeMemoRadiSam system protein B